ncbi:hypothetical protein [Paracoccus sp. (in: a-proteobacteria)]|uniref:hypothetical protein n=1 Tax=Paracoccus sp. TaxID=267 RepID=UPI003A85DCBF
MAKVFALAALLGATALAGCTQNINPTDADRAAIGAAAGALAGYVGDRKESDIYKYAAVGAVGGALCDDVSLCQ